jgi:hypothetical protein
MSGTRFDPSISKIQVYIPGCSARNIGNMQKQKTLPHDEWKTLGRNACHVVQLLRETWQINCLSIDPRSIYRVGQTQLGSFLWQMAAAIYRQQKLLSHFPVCCWIDWLLMIKNYIIESGPPCISYNHLLTQCYMLFLYS